MTPFDAYTLYLACKMHFTQTGYDYFKYNAKVRANPQSFETRKDKFFFYKLSKKDDLLDFYVSNMLEKPDIWAGELVTDKCKEIYENWKRHQQSLTYNFTNEVQQLYPDFDDKVKVKNGQHPELYKLYRQNVISIETLIILDEVYNIFEYWNREIVDPVLWPKSLMICKKYKGFLHYDIKKFKSVLKNIIASS